MKILIGIVTFGNSMFTVKAIDSCYETITHDFDVFVVVGKPDDRSTVAFLEQRKIPFIVHEYNKGFPASVNDIYDYGFLQHDYDAIIFMGNDVIAYPYAIDNMIQLAEASDYDAISSEEVNVKDLVDSFPETKRYFTGDKYVIHDFSSEPWKKYTSFSKEIIVTDGNGIIDIHNLCLYKRRIFELVGYIDTNFYPAYFEDNDYVRRLGQTDAKTVTTNSKYFHFWSRTLHQETGGSSNKFFELNRQFYVDKWGGEPRQEKFTTPFNGKTYVLTKGLVLPSEINITSRFLEPHVINYWKNK